VEEELGRAVRKCEELKKETIKLAKEKTEVQLASKVTKEREIATEMKNQIETALFESDLRNLKDSFKVGRKISEFESKHS
jgi:hypothetical protein